MQDSNDSERLERWRRGDESGLVELVNQYRRPLFGFILRMMEGSDEAEDIYQDVWFRAIRGLDRYRDRHFLSWLFRIAHNLVIDRSRRHKPAVPLDAGNGDQAALEAAGPAPSPADGLATAELRRRIQTAVGNLPLEQREVFLMRMDAELPFKEIARIQKTSINTALARMSYALGKLRAALAEDYTLLTRG